MIDFKIFGGRLNYIGIVQKLMIVCVIFCFSFQMNAQSTTHKLYVKVNNIKEPGGSVRLVIYDTPESFLVKKKVYKYTQAIAVGNSSEVNFEFDLPVGVYAAGCYHDVNDDHHMDVNYLGIPTEAYGVSNNPKVKWRKPTFQEAMVDVKKSDARITIVLKKW